MNLTGGKELPVNPELKDALETNAVLQSDYLSDKDKLRLKVLETALLQAQIQYQNASQSVGSAQRALENGLNQLFKTLNVDVNKYGFNFQTMTFQRKDQ